MSYTDAELEAMMTDLESDLVERKESAQDGRKIRRNICAFANDLPRNGRPGVLIPLAKEALRANGNPPPEFRFEQQLVTATVRARRQP